MARGRMTLADGDLKAAVAAGRPVAEIARDNGMTVLALQTRLRRMRAAEADPVPPGTPLSDTRLAAELERGASANSIAARYGLDRKTVLRRKARLEDEAKRRGVSRAQAAIGAVAPAPVAEAPAPGLRQRSGPYLAGPIPLPVNPYCRPCGQRVGEAEVAACLVRGCRRKETAA